MPLSYGRQSAFYETQRFHFQNQEQAIYISKEEDNYRLIPTVGADLVKGG